MSELMHGNQSLQASSAGHVPGRTHSESTGTLQQVLLSAHSSPRQQVVIRLQCSALFTQTLGTLLVHHEQPISSAPPPGTQEGPPDGVSSDARRWQ
eukprot:469047-Pelagomonas_calceolata.AAC.1